MNYLMRSLRLLVAALAIVSIVGLGDAGAREPVDLNTATEAELVELPGIGPAKAKAIVEYRSGQPFRSADEILNVPGIGPATFESLKDQIRVSETK